jgi:hypothetical protein
MAKKGKTKRSTVRSKRKPNNPREALAWLYTIADHIQESLEDYLAHKPSRGWRVQWLANTRRLWWFANAVKAYSSAENKKSLGQLLGLERGQGNPGGRRKSGRSFDLAHKISEQRETESETRKTRQGKPARRTWKGNQSGSQPGRPHKRSGLAAAAQARVAGSRRRRCERVCQRVCYAPQTAPRSKAAASQRGEGPQRRPCGKNPRAQSPQAAKQKPPSIARQTSGTLK